MVPEHFVEKNVQQEIMQTFSQELSVPFFVYVLIDLVLFIEISHTFDNAMLYMSLLHG